VTASTQRRHPLPPLRNNESGRTRRVGVELEFGGLGLDDAAHIVAAHVGGSLSQHGRYEKEVVGDAAGRWGIEVDFAWLKELGRRELDPDATLTPLQEVGEDALREASGLLVPVEVVSPPLSMERLGEVDDLIGRLRRGGAQGTGGGLLYAFGLQLNPEVPDTRPTTVLRYLQAFLCLADWLEKRAEVDLARRLTVFVDPFPKAYVRRVIDPDYGPDLAQLIDDYLALNPTRNRALDFLPLFLHLDEGRVRAVVRDPRVKPRPALHYRLPNCEIDVPGWGLGQVWRNWLQVEHLVAEPDRLRGVCAAYAAYLDRFLSGLLEKWDEEVTPWLKATDDL
jgi:hypothetical protein